MSCRVGERAGAEGGGAAHCRGACITRRALRPVALGWTDSGSQRQGACGCPSRCSEGITGLWFSLAVSRRLRGCRRHRSTGDQQILPFHYGQGWPRSLKAWRRPRHRPAVPLVRDRLRPGQRRPAQRLTHGRRLGARGRPGHAAQRDRPRSFGHHN